MFDKDNNTNGTDKTDKHSGPTSASKASFAQIALAQKIAAQATPTQVAPTKAAPAQQATQATDGTTAVPDLPDPPSDLPNLPVGRAVWKPAPDFATSVACWLTAGAAHHTVMSTAVGVDVFRDFAEIARTELLVIDETTTQRDFAREVRWNQAYYRLAAGL